jgi:Uma2 family endonuclease
MATIAQSLSTPEELLAMPNSGLVELVDGALVEKNMGAESSYIGGEILRLLGNHCREHKLGWAFGADCGYHCFPDRPNDVRKPDVSFVRLGRLEGERVPEGFLGIAPDLAVEVVSPNDLVYEAARKLDEHLRAGVPLVWVVNPSSRTVLVYRGDGSIQGLRAEDELSGESVIPGFRCRVEALFPPAPAPPTPA